MVVNIGCGITVVVKEIVWHATVVVDAEIIVEPTLVDVYVEAEDCERNIRDLKRKDILTNCIRVRSDANGDWSEISEM